MDDFEKLIDFDIDWQLMRKIGKYLQNNIEVQLYDEFNDPIFYETIRFIRQEVKDQALQTEGNMRI